MNLFKIFLIYEILNRISFLKSTLVRRKLRSNDSKHILNQFSDRIFRKNFVTDISYVNTTRLTMLIWVLLGGINFIYEKKN
jgi:hypothetical protein